MNLVKLTPVIPVCFTECKQGFIYIDNLCGFIYHLIREKRPGVFHPQDGAGISTFTLLSEIAGLLRKKVWFSEKLGKILSHFHKVPLVIKIYGGVSYSTGLSNRTYNDYSKVDYKEALMKTIVGSETLK